MVDIQLGATLGMIIFTGLIVAAVMHNSWIGMLAGFIAGGAIMVLIYLLIQSDSTYQIKRGD
jgi:cytochrome c oxidase subunit IV